MNPLFERAKLRGVDPKTLFMLEQFEAEIAQNPRNAYSYATMGVWWHWQQQYSKSLELLNTAIEINPRYAYALIARADIRATCPDPTFRDGKLTLEDAEQANQIARIEGLLKKDWRHRMYLRTLGAAYAETGDFESAIRVETEALKFSYTSLAISPINERLIQYQSRTPFRDSRGIMQRGPDPD